MISARRSPELPWPLQAVLDNAYVRPGDAVFAAGSLIEGIGNALSDLDVYVITRERRRGTEVDCRRHHRVINIAREIVRSPSDSGDVLLIHSVAGDSFAKLDVEFVTFDDAAALFERIRRLYEYAAANLVLMTARLTSREEGFIHRLLHCLPLVHEARVRELQSQIDIEEYCYLAYRWVASDFSVLLDIVGAWQAREYPRAVDIARTAIVRETLGLLHLLGCTRVGYKWVPIYVSRSGELSPEIQAEFTWLFCPDQLAGDGRKRDYVVRALDFLDVIFARSRGLLEKSAAAPSGSRALGLLQLDHQCADHASRYAKLEYAYRAKVYGEEGIPCRAFLDM
jgi:hypothetical protein